MSAANEPARGDAPPTVPDLTGPEAEELLRAAAELAIELARAGTRVQPPHDVPRGLRPLLGHARVTRAALATARRVVESDPGFRARMAAAVDVAGAAETLGPAGVLWLSRPEGWEVELNSLVAQARAVAAIEAEEAGERSATRRLRHAEEARERAERVTEEARTAAEAARLELQEERRLRRNADEAAAQARRHAASLEEQLRAAHRQASVAKQRVTEQAEAAAAAARALTAADADLRELRTELAGLHAAGTAGPSPPLFAPAALAEPIPVGDLASLGEAVAAASSAALELSAALGRAARALGPAHAGAGSAPADAAPELTLTTVAAASGLHLPAATRPRWARSARRPTRRRPARLPPFVLDDSPEAAEHLVGLPNVALLVDGYNATLTVWPELPLPEQRRRLVDALTELASRTGARPEIVFDGADTVPSLRTDTKPRSLVRVSFTAPDVEADDVLIARASGLPLPVVVVSDDQRVREGARSAGANVLSVQQLLAALRRNPS